jgi:hypothetical protein
MAEEVLRPAEKLEVASERLDDMNIQRRPA